MKYVIEIKLIGAANDKITLFIIANNARMEKSYYLIDGKSMRQIVDESGYNDYKIESFYINSNIKVVDLTK